jgi:hypothetical protein
VTRVSFHFFASHSCLKGINLSPTFSRRATHLLCPSGAGLKFEKACQWGIPVVTLDWLVKMAETGQVPGLEGFLVSAPRRGDVAAPEVPVVVGVGAQMNDVTNSRYSY